MGITVGELQVEIEGKLGELRSSFKKVEGDVDRFTKRGNKAINNFEKNTSKALGGIKKAALSLGLGLGVAGFVRGIQDAVTALDSIAKTADKLGLTIESLQELRFAAELSGVGIAALDVGIQRFTRRAAEAAQGTGEARAALAELGVAVQTADGNLRSTDAILNDVADAFLKVEGQSDRVRLAFKLFDTEGVALVNLLNKGSEGLEEFRRQARETGAVIGEETVREAERLNDELTILQRGLQGDFRTAFINFAPAIRGFAKAITDASISVGLLFDAFREPEDQGLQNLQRQSVELSTRLAFLGDKLTKTIATFGTETVIEVGFVRREIEGVELQLKRVDAELERRANRRRARSAEGAAEEEGPLAAPVTAPADETAAKALAVLDKQRLANLNAILSAERAINDVRLDRVEPLNAELSAIAEQVRTLQELDLSERGRIARQRVFVQLGEEAALIQGKLVDGLRDQIGFEIDLERKLERALALDKARAEEIERATRARLAEAVGVEATNEALKTGIEGLTSLIDSEEADEAAESLGQKIGESVERGVVDGLVGAATGEGISAFSDAFASIVREALGATFEDLVGTLKDQLTSALKDVLPSGEGGGGIAAGLGAAIGLGGALLAGALKSTSSSQSFAQIGSAVTSTQEVRGIVAGPTNIPIAQVGNKLKEAQAELLIEVRAIRGLVAVGVSDARTGSSAANVDSAVASELNGSPALA